MYPGSKWNIAKDIAELLPPHHSYLEPYFGSGAVFFSKEPSNIETINDMNSEVINLFSCIREDAEKLARYVTTTPYAREEYENLYLGEGNDKEPYEKARSFLIRCWQGHAYRDSGEKVGWKNDRAGRESMYALRNWYQLPENILSIAERLREVQIENRPAIELIKTFNNNKVCMYLDPPYVLSTRKGKQYRHECSDEEHEQLLAEIVKNKAKIIISGYESPLYDHYLKEWEKIAFQSCAAHGERRVEYVWLNFKRYKQYSVFDGE